MKVQSIMTPKPATSGLQSNLAEIARLMWQQDCGIVPLTDQGGKLTGIVTDRDICIAAATKDRAPSQIAASELVHGDLIACRPDDDVQTALRLMQQNRIRRVPVTRADGTLEGIVSLNDLVLAAGEKADVRPAEVVETLKSICAHRPQAAPARAAAAGAA